ncbi:DinB family protein [Terrilactibacillus sp. S3-3]|nr:DinB family protein [Terrilactibacillus sp. S3-3]
MSDPYIQQSIDSVQRSLEQIIETTKGLTEAIIRKKPSEEEWSIMQILCHVLEVGPYWIGEIKKIQSNPQIKWGRGLKDEARLKAVETTDERSVSDVLN